MISPIPCCPSQKTKSLQAPLHQRPRGRDTPEQVLAWWLQQHIPCLTSFLHRRLLIDYSLNMSSNNWFVIKQAKCSESGQALYLRLPQVQELLLDKATAKIDEACELASNNWVVWGAPLKVITLLLDWNFDLQNLVRWELFALTIPFKYNTF